MMLGRMSRYVNIINNNNNNNRLSMLLGRSSSLVSLSLQIKTNVMKVIYLSIYLSIYL